MNKDNQHTTYHTQHKEVHIWPDFAELSFFAAFIFCVFYFTGLEIHFERDNVDGIYMEFTKIGNEDD